MLAAVRQERPDALVHLGDHANDARVLAEEYPLLPLVTVKGNCDLATDAPEQARMNWDGTVIFAVHGHRYHVKNGLLSLRYAALEQGAHIALFFVKGEYHGRGIGSQLFKTVLQMCPAGSMTVNSSPYAVPIYHHLGFHDTDKEQAVNGLRFTPMEWRRT